MSIVDHPGHASTSNRTPRSGNYQRQRSLGHFSLSIALAVVIIWSWNGSELDPQRLAESGTRIVDFLGRMLPPNTSVMPIAIASSAETLRIAVLGTVGSVLLSGILGCLAAINLTPRWVHMPIKMLLAIIRGVPLILLAMLLVGAVGLGPLPGILAIAFHSTGMLAKFYAESIENIDPAPFAALESAGATTLQQLRFAAWPQIAPDLLRDTLFRFEMNLRESLILGVVGAGGIGFYIQMYVRAFQYEKVATLAIVVVAFVVLIEVANSVVRHMLR